MEIFLNKMISIISHINAIVFTVWVEESHIKLQNDFQTFVKLILISLFMQINLKWAQI